MPLKRKRQKQNKIDVVKDFIEIIGTTLEKRFGLHPTSKDIVRHFVERGIIDPRRIRNFMIIADFDRMLVGNQGSRTHTWMDLSIKYDISESQAQNIVYKERKKSQISSNIIY
tara:strand:- start:690 stop:1028 length:339 start_codon:yes stop_codon:yes gene_type:complete